MKNSNSIFQKKKVCVIVPTYNNELTLESVLNNVYSYTDQIIVVNDGSTDTTGSILSKFPLLEIVTYRVNKGKGYALRQGFKRAIEMGYHHAISIDSDGQHYADDLPSFLQALQDDSEAIIIGERNMNQASVPGKSSFGKNFSNFWFEFETGIKLNDTQSGYRLYPIKRLDGLQFLTQKFEFEIEVLVRSAWSGIPIKEVPVKVFYAEKGKRVSHFRPVRDFTRISILNTILVTITLLYIKPRDFVRGIKKNFWSNLIAKLFNPAETDSVKAISVGFGVFMGIFPIWGFQLVVAIALAFLFRLNKALVIIAANISIPPMIPLILFLSHLTGSVWMGDHAIFISFDKTLTIDLLKDSFIQYVSGAITLSICCGIVFGLITYGLLKLFKRKVPA
jgi:glycosyltransferase involved in cell wall biosynthesis